MTIVNKHRDNYLEMLFQAARAARTDTSKLEDGLEDRIASRLRTYNGRESLLAVWTWRLAPVMAALFSILVVLSAAIEPQEPSDVYQPHYRYIRQTPDCHTLDG
jgi:hypothetical protein